MGSDGRSRGKRIRSGRRRVAHTAKTWVASSARHGAALAAADWFGINACGRTIGELMAGQPGAGHGPGRPEIIKLESVRGFVVLDLPDASVCAGGTRLAPDVTITEVALLARAMTYKFAALGDRVGGAKAGVVGDSADRVARAEQMARYCAEIRPLADAGRFLTGPDMGTFEEDFKLLRERRPAPTAFGAVVAGVPFEDLLTGYGVAVAAETALHGGPDGAPGPKRSTGSKGWDGHSVAIEGFGKVGGGVAREVSRRGGRVVAVSTVAGSVADPSGLDIEL